MTKRGAVRLGTGRKNTRPTSSLGGSEAGTRPTGDITTMSLPTDCKCAWQIHGERNPDGTYTGLYWWSLKFRYTDCEAFRKGIHK
jgi:hypothetical protein